MVSENTEIRHSVFGKGTVVQVNGKYMTVRFSQTQKTFVYPDAFEKYLTLADGTVTEEILKDLEQTKAEKQAIVDAKIAENKHAMDHGIVMPGKDIIVDQDDDESSRSSDTEEI